MRHHRKSYRQRPMGAGQRYQQHSQKRCPAGIHYAGNIFLLGLSTLLTELIDLRAASALEILLEPFQCENGTDLEQDILAAGLGNSIGNIELLDIAEQEQ